MPHAGRSHSRGSVRVPAMEQARRPDPSLPAPAGHHPAKRHAPPLASVVRPDRAREGAGVDPPGTGAVTSRLRQGRRALWTPCPLVWPGRHAPFPASGKEGVCVRQRGPTPGARDLRAPPGTCPVSWRSIPPAQAQRRHRRSWFPVQPSLSPTDRDTAPASCPIGAAPCRIVAGCWRRSIPQSLSRPHSIAAAAPRTVRASRAATAFHSGALAPPPSAPSFPASTCLPTGPLFLDGPGEETNAPVVWAKLKGCMKNQTAQNTNNKPVRTLRHGVISASIWRQDTEKGPMFNVTFQRSYKEGEEWKSSTSFGRNNLLLPSFMAMPPPAIGPGLRPSSASQACLLA